MSNQDNHSPAFQFYPKDFMTSEKVAEMTFTEKGIYLHLLCLCWTNKGIKQDTKFERIIGPEWEGSAEAVLACFEVIDGRLWNPRLYRELKKQDKYAEKKRRAGKASGVARKSRNTKDKEQVFNSVRTECEQRRTLPSPSPSPSPNNTHKEAQAFTGDSLTSMLKIWDKHIGFPDDKIRCWATEAMTPILKERTADEWATSFEKYLRANKRKNPSFREFAGTYRKYRPTVKWKPSQEPSQ